MDTLNVLIWIRLSDKNPIYRCEFATQKPFMGASDVYRKTSIRYEVTAGPLSSDQDYFQATLQDTSLLLWYSFEEVKSNFCP